MQGCTHFTIHKVEQDHKRIKTCKTLFSTQDGPELLQRPKILGRWLQQPGLLLLLYSNYISVLGNGLKMF